MNRRRSRESGFSLVELLIAFFVLLIGILAILVLFPVGMRESKSMMEASMAAFVSRSARGLMEAQPFYYTGDDINGDGQPDTRNGFGTASLIQARYGPPWCAPWGPHPDPTHTPINFPVMFPWDVLGNDNDPTFPIELRPDPDNAGPAHRDRVLEASNPQFSWDARFTVGRGISETPPANFGDMFNPPRPSFTLVDWQYQYYAWFSQYFKYYAVQISVYRNYREMLLPPGTIWTRAPLDTNGNPLYSNNDPNRPLYSELALTIAPTGPDGRPLDLMIGTAIRIRDDRSDWYRITAVTVTPGHWTYKLDRPYAWKIYPDTWQAERNITGLSEVSAPKNDIIATNSLLDSFTTILESQLDDVNMGNLRYPPN